MQTGVCVSVSVCVVCMCIDMYTCIQVAMEARKRCQTELTGGSEPHSMGAENWTGVHSGRAANITNYWATSLAPTFYHSYVDSACSFFGIANRLWFPLPQLLPVFCMSSPTQIYTLSFSLSLKYKLAPKITINNNNNSNNNDGNNKIKTNNPPK